MQTGIFDFLLYMHETFATVSVTVGKPANLNTECSDLVECLRLSDLQQERRIRATRSFQSLDLSKAWNCFGTTPRTDYIETTSKLWQVKYYAFVLLLT